MARMWILGAADPEMERIEQLLRAAGEVVKHASVGWTRVRPEEAYQANCPAEVAGSVYLVECDVAMATSPAARIDHHRPGDPGYGQPATKFWAASSIGQVATLLSVAPTKDLVLAAAADHCLAAAYRGECPGVNPDELMQWRVGTRAAFQKRSAADILKDVSATRDALHEAPLIELVGPADLPHTEDHDWSRSVCDGCRKTIAVVDMRRTTPYPELPEAAAREGVGYISGPLPDASGRAKFTCAGSAEQVQAFLDVWSPKAGMVGQYGDPARGFAGAYLPKEGR